MKEKETNEERKNKLKKEYEKYVEEQKAKGQQVLSFEKYLKMKKTLNNVKTVGEIAAGSALIAKSKNLVLGKKKVYHGTSKNNWESIKKTGLKKEYGGSDRGSSSLVGDKDFINNSKGKVHFATKKGTGNFYANLRSPSEYKSKTNIGRHKEQMKKPKRNGNGKVITINMDYDKYLQSEKDPDMRDGVIIRNENGRKKKFNFGARRLEQDISPEEIKGSDAKMTDRVKHTAKNLPGYIKRHPGRFAAGAGLAVGGTALAAHAIRKKLKERKAMKELEKELKNSKKQNEKLNEDLNISLLEHLSDNFIVECYIDGYYGYYNEYIDNPVINEIYKLGEEDYFFDNLL